MLHRLCLILCLFTTGACATAGAKSGGGEAAAPTVSEAERKATTEKSLRDNPNSVAIYARGLCCPSCAIGVRVKASTLDWIDQARFNRGIDMNAKTMVVLAAVAEGKTADREQLADAIRRAGYDAVTYYWMEDGAMQSASLEGK